MHMTQPNYLNSYSNYFRTQILVYFYPETRIKLHTLGTLGLLYKYLNFTSSSAKEKSEGGIGADNTIIQPSHQSIL